MGNEEVNEASIIGFRFDSVLRGVGGEPMVEYASQSKVVMRKIRGH